VERQEEYGRFFAYLLANSFQYEIGQSLAFYPKSASFAAVDFDFLERRLVDDRDHGCDIVTN
jgi:hypothetical protein